jgi:hypothetical protein
VRPHGRASALCNPASLTMAAKKAYLLRVDPAVWVEVERLAQADLRSVNAQIEFLLRDALARRGVATKPPAAKRRKSAGARRA